MIELRNLSKKYKIGRNNELFALKNINALIEEGDFISVVGKNGSGKTTLLKIMSGLVDCTSGNILLRNNLSFNDIALVSSNERSFFSDFTVFENLNFFQSFFDKDNKSRKKSIISSIEKLNLSKFYKQKFKFLSSGEKKKMSIIRALLRKPKVLLLDEYSLSLDMKSRYEIKKEIFDLNKNNKTTIIQSTHLLEDIVGTSNKLMLLNDKGLEEKLISINVSFKDLKEVVIDGR